MGGSSKDGQTSAGGGGGGGSDSGGRATAEADPLAFLARFDTVFLIDDSGSMWGKSWTETERALQAIAPVCTARDEDGVDVYFLNHETTQSDEGASAGTGYRGVRSAAEVAALFRSVGLPRGRQTLTGMRLQRILQTYLRHYEKRVSKTGDEGSVKPINIIVLTDGRPHDEPGDVIRSAAARLDRLDAPPYQVGIQFFQVDDDPDASEALRQLDDELRRSDDGEKLRDIVDTVTFDALSIGGRNPELTSEGILKTVLGAVNRRLDRTTLDDTRRRS